LKELILPGHILLGSATAATQIEGGDKNSNWYHWSLKGRIANNESSLVAADHYNRVEEDIKLMTEMNHEVYRLSIEWSRFEPKEGVWSEEGIDHYRNEIKALLKVGIKPLVTLHHFSHPQWFEEKGAWTSKGCIFYFKRFAEKVIEAIGSDVSEYCTINEPNVFVNDTYLDGKYPPGRKNDMISYFKAAKNMIRAHLQVYELIHRMRKKMGYSDTMVGIAMHLAYFDVIGQKPLARLSRKLMDYSFHQIFLNGMVAGRLTFLLGMGSSSRGVSSCDFLGVNYYSRHIIHSSLNPAMLFGEVKVEKNLLDHKVNDLGWEIYPEGLYRVIKAEFGKYNLPIYITENGIPDEKDRKRARFIYDHLVEVDYETQERRIRKSGRFYGEICKSKKITEEMIQTYLKD
jgi:beta-glucosidase